MITSLLVAGHHDPLRDGDSPVVRTHASQPLIRAALSPAQIQLNFQLFLKLMYATILFKIKTG